MSRRQPGLEQAIDLARNQFAHYSRKARDEDNPENYEDHCAALAMHTFLEKLEAALDEDKRQDPLRRTVTGMTWEQIRSLHKVGVR